MEWQFVIALAIAIPVILLPVFLVWFLNVGGLLRTLRERRARARGEANSNHELVKHIL